MRLFKKLLGLNTDAKIIDEESPKSNVCDTGTPCEQADCLILELRNTQNMIKELKIRIANLQNKYFPMLYWWLAFTMKAGKHIVWRIDMFKDASKPSKGDIQDCLNFLHYELHSKNITSDKFDIDQFCSEIRDFVENKDAIKSAEKSLAQLTEEEKRLKKLLGIV